MSFAQPSAVREGPSHLPGVTRLAYSRDGATIFTGGADCMLRYHNVNEPDSEPGFFDEHRDPITCLATTSTNLLTGCEDGTTRSFDYPANEFAGNLARSSGVAVRWLAIDKAGEKVALCSDDLLVKIVNIKDPMQISVLPGLSRPVRSASWHTRQDMLTVITSDGKIQVYEFEEGNASCLKTIEALAVPGKPEDELSCAVAWHPRGDYFVVPTRSHDIAIVDRHTWTRQGNFSASGHDGEIGLLAWSPNGMYLASSGKDDQIIVWETEGKQPVSRVKVNGGTVTGLEFSPTDNALSWACVDGTFSTWTDPVPAEEPHPARQPRVHATRQNGLGENGEGFGQLEGEDDDDMGEDLADFDNDDWIIDDEEGGVNYKDREASPNLGNGVREVVGITKAQAAFQPGSTAMRNKKRYLAFNMIGVVDVTDQDTHHVVNVEFHDKSADRRGYHFQDHNRFHLAAVGEQGIVYGSHADGDLPALIHYRAYDTWASGADWQVSLPAGEEPVLLAAGGKPLANEFEVENQNMGSVIVATSRGFIRFFTGSGVQRYLWRMGEDMVSMVASEEMVFLVHREGGTSLDGCQNLRYTLVDLDSYDIVQEGRLPLPKKTTLAWIGFSRSGAPAMYDSSGLLSLLDRSRRPGQARWSPLVDTRALVKKEGGNQTAYWPVGLNDKQMMCVILKGNEREPYFPRPVILDVDMTIPLLNLDISQGQLEEKLMQEQLQLNLLRDLVKDRYELSYDISKLEVSQDKELIQLVQAACKADKLQRALDIVRMMNNVKSMEAAAKVAQFYHLPGLQEKIGIIREATEEKRREKERSERHGGYRMVARETPLPESPYGATSRSSLSAAQQATEFAPRSTTSKRTARASVGAPLYPAVVPRHVSETPEPMSLPTQDTLDAPEDTASSPESKRRRLNVGHVEDDGFKRPQLPSESVVSQPVQKSGGLKNPFARKAQASNPFAKSNIASTTQAKKSYSFFEKVEDAEQAAIKNAAKDGQVKSAKKVAKQTTLSLAPKAPISRPSLQSEDSLASTVVDSVAGTPTAEQEDIDMEGELEETQTDEMPLRASPSPMMERSEAVADDDAEPLEWADSDDEELAPKAQSDEPDALEA